MKTKVYLLRIKSLSIITSYIILYAIKSSFFSKDCSFITHKSIFLSLRL